MGVENHGYGKSNRRQPAVAYCRGSYSGLNGCAVQFTGCYLYARRKFKRYLMIPRNPTLVLVDSSIIAAAPVRFLVSGIGDALATGLKRKIAASKGQAI